MKVKLIVILSFCILFAKAQTIYTSYPGNFANMFSAPEYITMVQAKIIGPLNQTTDIETLRTFCTKNTTKRLTNLDLEDAYFSPQVGQLSVDAPNDNIAMDKTLSPYLFSGFGFKRLVLPSSIDTIGDWALSGCTDLQMLEFPKNLEAIGNYACHQCINLNEINIPEGLTTIGKYAFEDCSSVQTIKLPSTLTKIGDRAFLGIGIMPVDVWIYSVTPPKTDAPYTSLFGSHWNNVTLHVPMGTTDAYLDTEWGNASEILEFDATTSVSNVLTRSPKQIKEIYDSKGKECIKMDKGVYIIRYSDNTTQKVIK